MKVCCRVEQPKLQTHALSIIELLSPIGFVDRKSNDKLIFNHLTLTTIVSWDKIKKCINWSDACELLTCNQIIH